MNKFFKEILFSIIGLLFLNLIIVFTIIYPEVYGPYEDTLENIDNTNFIFADSHGWSLTNNNPEGEKLLDENNITNLSYGSDSYFDIYFKLNYLINEGIEIDTIYLSADPHMIGKQRLKSNNRNRSIKYTAYETYTDFFPMSYPEFFFRKHIRKYISTFDVNNSKLIQSFIESKFKNKEISKPEWENLSQDIKEQKSNSKFSTFYERGISIKQKKVLNNILSLCSKNKIQVVLVDYPLAQEMEVKEIPDNFKNVVKLFKEKNYKVIDIKGLDAQYFSNQDHVNSKGAEIVINKILNSK